MLVRKIHHMRVRIFRIDQWKIKKKIHLRK